MSWHKAAKGKRKPPQYAMATTASAWDIDSLELEFEEEEEQDDIIIEFSLGISPPVK